MKTIIVVLTSFFFTINLTAQVIKVKSTSSNRTDNNLNVVKLEGTSYFTFDFTKKVITLKTVNSGGTHNYTFKMLSFYKEKSLVGNTTNIRVSSTTMPSIVKIFYGSDLLSAIWLDAADYTITYSGLSEIL